MTNQGRDPFQEVLMKGYAAELFAQLESLSVSAGEAAYRDNFDLASIHFDQIKLVGKELSLTLRQIGGDKA